eukprot:10515209-Karenia_brevis.AAC.1
MIWFLDGEPTHEERRLQIGALQAVACTADHQEEVVVEPVPDYQPKHSCVTDCFRSLGVPVPRMDGPMWVMRDGNKLLHPFGYCNVPVPRTALTQSSSYLVCEGGSCYVLGVLGRATVKMEGEKEPQLLDAHT